MKYLLLFVDASVLWQELYPHAVKKRSLRLGRLTAIGLRSDLNPNRRTRTTRLDLVIDLPAYAVAAKNSPKPLYT